MRMKAGRLEFYNGDKHIGDMIVIPRPPKSKSMLSALPTVLGFVFLAIALFSVILLILVIFS